MKNAILIICKDPLFDKVSYRLQTLAEPTQANLTHKTKDDEAALVQQDDVNITRRFLNIKTKYYAAVLNMIYADSRRIQTVMREDENIRESDLFYMWMKNSDAVVLVFEHSSDVVLDKSSNRSYQKPFLDLLSGFIDVLRTFRPSVLLCCECYERCDTVVETSRLSSEQEWCVENMVEYVNVCWQHERDNTGCVFAGVCEDDDLSHGPGSLLSKRELVGFSRVLNSLISNPWEGECDLSDPGDDEEEETQNQTVQPLPSDPWATADAVQDPEWEADFTASPTPSNVVRPVAFESLDEQNDSSEVAH